MHLYIFTKSLIRYIPTVEGMKDCSLGSDFGFGCLQTFVAIVVVVDS